jgi:branched-chain amino acid transport system ATP-binding protein
MHTISGLLSPKHGSIEFNGADITKIKADKIVTLGLSQVPEGRHVFPDLSVRDNLLMGAYSKSSICKRFKDILLKAGLSEEEAKAKVKNIINESLDLVYAKFPILKERKNQSAGTLSGGEQQMLAVGRALMSHPKVLLLDEPSMGLSPLYVKEIFKTIKEINEQGTTILLVEQNTKMALNIADYAYVIETGKIVMDGPAKDLANDDRVKKAYLGG